ncbi:MAG TPA: TRAM domain-containing protein, partial [Lacibacter sp.]|nr:TRAM domain-containing protein [Lacibacter sp.]
LQEIVDKQYYLSLDSNKRDVGQTYKVLIEGDSKKDEHSWMGRSSHSKVIVFPKENYELKKGDYVMVKVDACTKGTLLGTITNQ